MREPSLYDDPLYRYFFIISCMSGLGSSFSFSMGQGFALIVLAYEERLGVRLWHMYVAIG